MNFFLGFQQHFPLLALAAANGVVDDALGLLLGTADFLFGDLLAIGHADNEEQHAAHEKACDSQDERQHVKFHK